MLVAAEKVLDSQTLLQHSAFVKETQKTVNRRGAEYAEGRIKIPKNVNVENKGEDKKSPPP